MQSKKPYHPPTITDIGADVVAARNFLLADSEEKPKIVDITSRSGMPTERGIYELPPNRAGEHPIYALDSNGFIVGWERYVNEMDVFPAMSRLKEMLDREDPLNKVKAG